MSWYEGPPVPRGVAPPVELVDAVKEWAVEAEDPLALAAPVLDLVGDAEVVLLGEATHGTREFYALRAELTQRLVEERGFEAVVVEADWPDADRVDRFIRGEGEDRTAEAALGDFERFPRWMWRNVEVVPLLRFLRDVNAGRPAEERVGFHGMDLYSLHGSMDAVVRYLEQHDREAAARARERYACFETVERDPHRYGFSVAHGIQQPCEKQALEQLVELQRRSAEGGAGGRGWLSAEMNARLVHDAANYYATVYGADRNASWNVRDTHMADTLEALRKHLQGRGGRGKLVVWAHNSHLGDARATEMGDGGEVNVGQLCRERWGARVFNLGFTTHTGTVTAANEWDEPPWSFSIRPSMLGSYEDLFHRTGLPRFLLPLRALGEAAGALHERRLERAIGVLYKPGTERWSHYFHADLAAQFDAVVHVDTTGALEPLDERGTQDARDAPDTYPSGI